MFEFRCDVKGCGRPIGKNGRIPQSLGQEALCGPHYMRRVALQAVSNYSCWMETRAGKVTGYEIVRIDGREELWSARDVYDLKEMRISV